MKRTLRIGVAVGVLALTLSGLALGGAANASPRSPSRQLPVTSGRHGAATGIPVTAGSTWTWYVLELTNHQYCSVLTFGAKKAFTDDNGGSGKWSGSTKSTKISWSTGLPGFWMKDTWVSGDGYWEGSFTETNKIATGRPFSSRAAIPTVGVAASPRERRKAVRPLRTLIDTESYEGLPGLRADPRQVRRVTELLIATACPATPDRWDSPEQRWQGAHRSAMI